MGMGLLGRSLTETSALAEDPGGTESKGRSQGAAVSRGLGRPVEWCRRWPPALAAFVRCRVVKNVM